MLQWAGTTGAGTAGGDQEARELTTPNRPRGRPSRRQLLAAGGAGAVALGGGVAAWQLLGEDDAPRPETRETAWRYVPEGADLRYAQVAAVGNTLYLTVGSPPGLHAVDARSGRRRWLARLPERDSTQGELGTVTVAGGVVHVGTWGGSVHAFGVGDGARRWVGDSLGAGSPAAPVVLGSTVCVLAREIVDDSEYGGERRRAKGVLAGLDAETGAERWRHESANLLAGHAASSTLVAETEAGARLSGLDPRTGGARWSAPAPAHLALAGDAVCTLGAGKDHRLTVREAATGEVRWRAPSVRENGEPGFLALTVDERRGAVYACDFTGEVSAHALADGALRWRARIEEPCEPRLLASGRSLYAASGSGYGHQAGDGGLFGVGGKSGGYVLALSARDGEQRWRTDRTETSWSRPVAAGEGAVVVAHESGWWAYDVRTGAPRWRVDGDAKPGEPAASGGLLHLLDGEGVRAVRV